jgi:Predicted membrane protein
MSKIKSALTVAFGILMMLGGAMHFVNPEMYNAFIPDFMPKNLVNYISGLVEIIVGVFVFIPLYRSLGTFGILLMMVAFLPLHVADVFKENPAIGSHQLALIRLPLQFILIWWAWYIHKK